MLATAGLLLLLVLLTALLSIWRWRHFTYFRRLGIPGPRPNLLWGNLMEYHSTDLYKVIGRWIEKYGGTFGFYNGDVPFVVTLDLDLIEDVFVRNFKNFMNRGILPNGKQRYSALTESMEFLTLNIPDGSVSAKLTMATVQRHPYLGKSILHAPPPHWRSIRTTVAGGFTPAKLRLMMPDLEEDVSVFLRSLERYAKSGVEVHMLQLYEPLVMDYIGRRCFGARERFQDHPRHPLMALLKHIAFGGMTGAVHMVGQSITRFGPLMKPLCFFSLVAKRFRPTRLQTEKIIEIRRMDPAFRKPDFLQNLIEAKYVEREAGCGANQGENGIPKSRALTTDEVMTTAGTLCLAGFDTMTSSLCYFTFTLAKHSDVQEKVREEIREAVREQGALDYETVIKRLPYLEQVMNETLRLYPPGLTFVTRAAEQDFECKGINFKAGTGFMVPLYQIQRDARFWPEPEDFKPERFSPENQDKLNKRAFMPFGIGPRNCVGMKVAVLNLKFTMAKLVQRYCFELGPSQKGEMNLGSHAMVSEPDEGPWIILRHAKP